MKAKKVIKRVILSIFVAVLLFFLVRLFFPTWTPKIEGDSSVSELRTIEISGADLEVMMRGNDSSNPVMIFVHGGPCCSEIPYVRKYQDELEKDFTIVHYDQRGSGKSYEFGKDYSSVTAADHVADLIALTEYIRDYLGKDRVILAGHSYGTYIATQAAAERPDLYSAYVGIGQMSDTIQSELSTLQKCITAADREKDAEYLKSLESAIKSGEGLVPRDYVRKYGFASRSMDDNKDYFKGFFFGTEYNLMDAVRFYTASAKYQDTLVMEALKNPISELVTEIDVPVYFVMGRYDGMTSPEVAEEYLNSIKGEGMKEFVLFDESAHYPQFEEKEKFCSWMIDTFK